MRKLLVALGGLFLCLSANAQNGAVGLLTAQGADCTTAGACISLQFDINDVASASIQLSGTFTATVQFEASSDKGTTWVAIAGTPLNSSTAATSATTANTWKFNVASITNIRARASAWTSAPTVVIRSSRAVANAIGSGGAVYASGLGTVNVVPKGDGAGKLADSSITDNGTNVTTTEAILAPVGSGTLPGYSFSGGSSQAASGLAWTSGSLALIESNGGAGWLSVAPSAAGVFTGSTTTLGWGSSSTVFAQTVPDAGFRRRGAASIFLGIAADVNGTPAAQTLGVQNAITGTDLPGSKWVLEAPLGTGAGAGAATAINRAQILATGTTAQTGANAFVVCETKILSNTSATTTTIATIGLASNSGGGVTVFHSLTASDGTNFDSETQSYNVSFVNKAGVITVGTAQITASSAANNSGSATIGATITGASPTISLKVTPVFTTIVPTTVTAYTTIINHGAGAVTCQ